MNQNILAQNQNLTENKQVNLMENASKFFVPLLYILAGLLLAVSTQYSYWGLTLEAPQYPEGLEMRVYFNYITGDDDPSRDEVREIDGLNHYIGMKSLFDAATFERQIALPALVIALGLILVAALWHKRYTWLLLLPAMAFPFVFLADLAFWMTYYGQSLDPYAPLSSSIQPFTPPIIGEGVIGQFRTVAYVGVGWYLAVLAGLFMVIGIGLRYRRYLKQRAR